LESWEQVQRSASERLLCCQQHRRLKPKRSELKHLELKHLQLKRQARTSAKADPTMGQNGLRSGAPVARGGEWRVAMLARTGE
jgi:hypothetical protein